VQLQQQQQQQQQSKDKKGACNMHTCIPAQTLDSGLSTRRADMPVQQPVVCVLAWDLSGGGQYPHSTPALSWRWFCPPPPPPPRGHMSAAPAPPTPKPAPAPPPCTLTHQKPQGQFHQHRACWHAQRIAARAPPPRVSPPFHPTPMLFCTLTLQKPYGRTSTSALCAGMNSALYSWAPCSPTITSAQHDNMRTTID
jgi:hypothetical protein